MFVHENTGDEIIVAADTPKAPGPTAMAVQAATLTAAAIKEPSGPPTKVKVKAPYRCCHNGESHEGGDTVTIPAEIADHWIKNNWAELARVRSKPASQKGES